MSNNLLQPTRRTTRRKGTRDDIRMKQMSKEPQLARNVDLKKVVFVIVDEAHCALTHRFYGGSILDNFRFFVEMLWDTLTSR